MLAGFLVCLFVGLLIIFLGYQIHVKKRLFLLAGYQEETFVGDKNKLAKLSGAFSYIVGVATIILPLGLEKIGGGSWYRICYINCFRYNCIYN
ncbi:conserved hypothetical protein [Bacillus cereus B4264]|uniref:DUF3784 domain-containing protein n=1 Tax=Bacillus cereus (strain B4264) TaxID=405532 RepID=B7HIB7_BACC4|nr:conserved hypothetical protein [Bacillus cereus B4264]AKE16113.1 hypothetical protein FORC5_1576 [Bacillus cereus]